MKLLIYIMFFINIALNLSGKYFLEKDKVYYEKKINEAASIKSEVTEIDLKSFKIIDDIYAKDKNSAFYKGKRINFSNSESFEVINENLSFDDKRIYYLGEDGIIVDLDIPTLKIINDYYIQDKDKYYGLYENKINGNQIDALKVSEKRLVQLLKISEEPRKITGKYFFSDKNIYYEGKKIENVDLPSFKIMEYELSRDKNNIYFKGQKIKKLSGEDFINIDKNYFKSGNELYLIIDDNDEPLPKRMYNQLVKVENINFESLKILNKDFFEDKGGIFYKGNLIKDADRDTFKILEKMYSKDRDNIYVYDKKIEGADIETFEILNDYFSRDKNNVYYKNEKLNDFSGEISLLNEYLIKIGKEIYFGNKKIGSANKIKIIDEYFIVLDEEIFMYDFDGITDFIFKVKNPEKFKNIGYNYYYDGDSVYYFNKKIENIEIQKYKIINKDFIKDSKNVYYKNKKIPEIDVKTFKVLNEYYLKDKNNVYYNECYNNYRYECLEKIEITEIEKIKGDRDAKPVPNIVKNKEAEYFPVIVKEADSKTFEILKSKTKSGKDKKNYYFEGKKIEKEYSNGWEDSMKFFPRN